MKKILLAGEISDLMRSVNSCLTQEFEVQLCSEQKEHIQGMFKIVRPNLFILNLIGETNIDYTSVTWVKNHYPTLPILVIATREIWEECREYCIGKYCSHLFRPVQNSELLQECRRLLSIDEPIIRTSGNKTKELLIVDDSPLVLRNLKSILEPTYRTTLATSGEQALKLIEKNMPDLVLLDYEMPGLSGKDLFEQLKDREETADLPVVFLSSIASREKVYAVLRHVPNGYVLKPPDKSKLFMEIENALYHIS